MDNYQDSRVKNRILEIPSFIPSTNEDVLKTNEDCVYMEVNDYAINNLIETGILIANQNRSNCWSKGSKSKVFYDKLKYVIEARQETVRQKMYEDVVLTDLIGIWMLIDGKYANRLEYTMGAYMNQQNNNKRNHR